MPATFQYFPFDDQAAYETQWRQMAQTWRSTGILVQGSVMDATNGDCAVSPGTGLEIRIAPGKAWIKGHFFDHTDDYYYMPVSPNTSGTTRQDLVVIRADFTANIISYQILEGTTIPVQTPTIWDVPLAILTIPDGTTNITTSNITDRRVTSNQATFRPFCVLRRSTNISLSNNTNSDIDWNVVEHDPMGMFDENDPEVITILETGIYDIRVNTLWTNPSNTNNTRRIILFRDNGINVDAIAYGSTVGSPSLVDVGISLSRLIALNRGDQLYVTAYNNSGGTVEIKSSGLYAPVFTVVKVGESTGL